MWCPRSDLQILPSCSRHWVWLGKVKTCRELYCYKVFTKRLLEPVLSLWLYRGEQLSPKTLVRLHGISCSIFGGPFWPSSQNQTHYIYKIQLLALIISWTTQNMLHFQPGKLKCPQRVKGKPMATIQSVLVLPWKAISWKSSTSRYFHGVTKDRAGGNIKFCPVHPTVLR